MKILILMSAMSISFAKSITMGTAIIPPYQEYGKNGMLEGISIDPVKCIFNKMGQEFTIKVGPWAKVQENDKDFAGYFIASISERRNKLAVSSWPIIFSEWVWYWPVKNAFSPFNNKNMKTAKIATIDGTTMQGWLKKNYPNAISFRNPKVLFDSLLEGKLDAVLSTKHIYLDYLKRHNVSGKRFISKVARRNDHGVYFFKKFLEKNPDFLKKFNEQIQFCQSPDEL